VLATAEQQEPQKTHRKTEYFDPKKEKCEQTSDLSSVSLYVPVVAL